MFVPIKDFHSAKVAERVAMLMMQKIKSGSSEASPMLVELLDESRRSSRDGKNYKTTVAASFFGCELCLHIPLLLVTHCFLFPSRRFFLFSRGQKEPMPQL